jgi:hypothetical protein
MPIALTIDKLAQVLNTEVVAGLAADDESVARLSEPGSLIDVAAESAGLADDERAYLEDIPPTLVEGMRATIVAAIGAGKAVHLQFSPGYDFEARMWDYGGAVSIHISGPYPPDYPRQGFPPAAT